MTIKKKMKVAPAGGKPAETGGATIASRFKLDAIEPPKKASGLSGPAVTAAFITALLSLGVAGFLTFTLWKHWEFLMPV